MFTFTAPYSLKVEKSKGSKSPIPWYKADQALDFIASHGLGVRAVGAALSISSHNMPALHFGSLHSQNNGFSRISRIFSFAQMNPSAARRRAAAAAVVVGCMLKVLCTAGVLVEDAAEAHRKATAGGAISKVEPVTLKDEATGTEQVVSEVHLYGDVVLRFVSGSYQVR